MSDVPTGGSLSEEQASLVLKRATQMEAEGGHEVEVVELRKAALDAGIPLAAFERALAEVLSSVESPGARVSEPSPADSKSLRLGLRGWVRKTVLGVLGSAVAALGFAFGSEATDVMIPLSVFWALLIFCFLVVSGRRDRTLLGFESDLLALCVGLTLGWVIANPVDAVPILVGMSVAGTLAALVGGLVVGLARPRPEPAEQSPAALLGDAQESVVP